MAEFLNRCRRMHCVGRQDFFLSVAVFVQLSQPRTGGLVRAGSAMALSGRSRCRFRGNVCRRSLPSATAAPENVGARPSAPSALSDPEITPLRSNGLPAAGRCCGPSPARYRRNRPHQALEIQCGDRCGRCGRKWRPPFWCSGIAACLNDAADRPRVPENSPPTNLGQRSRPAGSGGVGRSW